MTRHEELKQELRQDIEAMRLQILRLQNQILVNEVALKEIEVHERAKAAVNVLKPSPAAPAAAGPLEPPAPVGELPTVPAMVEIVLPELREPFTYQDVIAACCRKWPGGDARKIRAGVYPAVINLKKKSRIVGDGTGRMMIGHQVIQPT